MGQMQLYKRRVTLSDGRVIDTQLTKELHTAIVNGLKEGNYVSTVMDALGVPRTNFYEWYRRGEPIIEADERGDEVGRSYPDDVFGDFRRDCDAAQAKAEMDAVQAIRNHFEADWKAAAEFLARRMPDHWNPKRIVEMQGKDGGPIQLEAQKREAIYQALDAMVLDPEALGPGDQEPEDQGADE